LQVDYVTVIEDKPTMSVKYCLPVPVFHIWPKLMHPAVRSLCDSWASYKRYYRKHLGLFPWHSIYKHGHATYLCSL